MRQCVFLQLFGLMCTVSVTYQSYFPTCTVRHSIPIKVRTSQADGDFLEMATKVLEGHPEFSIIPGLKAQTVLGVIVHPLPVDIAARKQGTYLLGKQ